MPATFAAIKKKLGETLSSKNPTAQINELLCKILAYDITVLIHESFERGIPLPGWTGDEPNGPVQSETRQAGVATSIDQSAQLSAPIGWVGGDN